MTIYCILYDRIWFRQSSHIPRNCPIFMIHIKNKTIYKIFIVISYIFL
jgi:hypothetical protein